MWCRPVNFMSTSVALVDCTRNYLHAPLTAACSGRARLDLRHSDVEREAFDLCRLDAARAGVGDRSGQRVARGVGLVLAGGLEQRGGAAEAERDAVFDRQAGGLAGVLDGVDDLARQP